MNLQFTSCRIARVTPLILALSGCATDSVRDCVDAPVQPKAIVESTPVASGLTTSAQHDYDSRQRLLKTNWQNHEIVLNPDALIGKLEGATHHPKLDVPNSFYLLAIEKPRKSDAVPKHSCSTGDYALDELRSLNHGAYEHACQALGDPRPLIGGDWHPMVPTHIVRFDGVAAGVYQKPCFLFNTYHDQFACADAPTPVHVQGTDPHSDGVKAIDALKQDLAKHLDGVTHVVVMSTGWNTDQDESLYNYLDWSEMLVDQKPAGAMFKPLIIGISWQSEFNGVLKTVPPSDVITKGNDADEIGLRWTNRLINDTLMPLADAKHIPVVLIGHSYGARVLGTAIYRRDAIKRNVLPGSPVAFLALQPAFTINHFDSGNEALFMTAPEHYPNTLVAMTSSPYDGATTKPRWGGLTYVGGGKALESVKAGKTSKLIGFTSVDGTGKINGAPMRRPGLYLVDASAIVNCRWPNTGIGGGAHDDVFTQQMGVFFWQAIAAAGANQ